MAAIGVLPLVFLLSNLAPSSCANILFIPPFVSESHKLVMIPWADQLASRGHNVLMWEPCPIRNRYEPKVAKWDHFTVEAPTKPFNLSGADPKKPEKFMVDFVWRWAFSRSFDESIMGLMVAGFCDNLLLKQRDKFDYLFNTKWDVVIIDELFNPCGYAVVNKLRSDQGTKLGIYMSNLRLSRYSSHYASIPSPPSYIGQMGMYEMPSDNMRFLLRAWNTVIYGIASLVHALCMGGAYRQLAPYFPENEERFGFADDSLSRPDMVFAAHFKQFEYPRPLARNLVHIGSLQTLIHKPSNRSEEISESLPKDIADLIAKHPRGFMIAALGHQAKWEFAPKFFKDAFFAAFKRLPKDFLVFFSYSADEPSNEAVPSNVQLVKWIPQAKLLAHPKIRLFLTHVGANSLAEAVLNGVPMVALPLFADQPDGAARVESFGLGRKIHKKDVSEKVVYEAIMDVLENKTYHENAEKFAENLKNEPELAMERAVYWTEHLVKLRKIEMDQSILNSFYQTGSTVSHGWWNSIQYHSLDIITVIVATSLIILILFIKYFGKLVMTILQWRST